MVIPDHIANAAQAADIEAVREWLTTNDVNDRATDTPGRNNFYQGSLLGVVTDTTTLTDAHVELVHMLLDRGADATLYPVLESPVHSPCMRSGTLRIIILVVIY